MNNSFINTLPLHNLDGTSDHTCRTIIIQTIKNDDSMDISLCYDNKGYIGSLQKLNQTIAANALEIDVEEFLAESTKALISENGLNNFIYSLETSDSTATFKWCKKVENGLTITYGSVKLEGKQNLLDELMVNSIRLNQMKDQQIDSLKSQIRQTDDDFNEMKVSLQKCVEEKNNLENVLLTKFAALLNSKKEKIVELERALNNRSNVDDQYESDGSGVDSDVDYCTQTIARPKSPQPSTSHQGVNMDTDSIVLPKRTKIQKVAEESVVNVREIEPIQTTQSSDVYDRETELLMDEM